MRATDYETSYKLNEPTGTLDTSARQRQTGIYAEGLWTPTKWTIGAGGRIDHFSNFDANQWTSPPLKLSTLPNISETVFDPRLGVARRLTRQLLADGLCFSRLSRADAERALSHRASRPRVDQAEPQPALRAGDGVGDRRRAGYPL